MYRAVVDFFDLHDNNRFYEAGESFPRPNYEPGAERIAELAGCNNRMGHPLIEQVEDEKKKPSRKKVPK